MKVTIEINCNNTAFDPDPTEELGRILENIGQIVRIRAIPEPGDTRPIIDINGSKVGALTVTE